MARIAPTMMPLSRCGAAIRVTAKVVKATMPSDLLACQVCFSAGIFTRPTTAKRMITAKVAWGRWYR